jgi:hypothetical protein
MLIFWHDAIIATPVAPPPDGIRGKGIKMKVKIGSAYVRKQAYIPDPDMERLQSALLGEENSLADRIVLIVCLIGFAVIVGLGVAGVL